MVFVSHGNVTEGRGRVVKGTGRLLKYINERMHELNLPNNQPLKPTHRKIALISELGLLQNLICCLLRIGLDLPGGPRSLSHSSSHIRRAPPRGGVKRAPSLRRLAHRYCACPARSLIGLPSYPLARWLSPYQHC